MTKAGAAITFFVALCLAGLGYFAYLKNHPAESNAAAEWARSIGKEQILPVVGLVVVATLGGVCVGVYRHHRRGTQAWADFAEQLGLPHSSAELFSSEPSRVVGEVEGRAFSLETRVARVQTSGAQRSSVNTDMQLELRGVPEGLTVTSATAGLGDGLLGSVARGLADELVDGSQAKRFEVRTGDPRFESEARAFCPDQEAARAWLQPRTAVLAEFLEQRGCRLASGRLIQSTRGKTDSVEQLRAQLARLSTFAQSLESVEPSPGQAG